MERKQTHLMYGGIIGLAMAILGLIMYIAGLSFEPWSPYVSYAIFLIGILLNAFAFSKANNNWVTFGNVFSSGFKTSAIITLVMILWSFISIWIFPEIKEKGLEMVRESMEKKGGMSDEQIEQTIEMSRKFFTVGMIGGLVIYNMFFGAIFSLIGAAIAKKKGPEPMVPQV